MKRVSITGLAVLLFSTLFAIAQNPPQMPKPGPEQTNLNFFAGTWTLTGDVKPGPMGPGGKFTGTENIAWMPGGFFLVSHSQGSSAMGKETGLAVYGYDSEKKVYTYDEFNNMGENVHATGAFDGKTWTWTSDSPMGGKPMKGRFVVTQTSPTAYTFKFDISQDGGANWMPIMDGSGKKAGGTAAKKK
jgi:Protein of unknown function (DUF1579)